MKLVTLGLAFVLSLDLALGIIKPNDRLVKVIRNKIHNMYRRDQNFGPGTVRLAFHDCIGTSCDGCIDFSQKVNNGLQVVVEQLQKLHKTPVHNRWDLKISDFLTRADLWAFAAKTSIEYGIRRNNNMCKRKGCPLMPDSTIRFRWGRQDCGPDPYTVVPKANGHTFVPMNRSEMMDFFDKDFGFTEEQVIALVGGGHSVGRAMLNNTGYEGKFFSRGNHYAYFNNGVFVRLTSSDIEFRSQPNFPNSQVDKKFQFNLFDRKNRSIGMMLNPDVQTAFDIDVSKHEGTKCYINEAQFPERRRRGDPVPEPIDPAHLCAKASTYDLVEEFATNPESFMTAFCNVFTLMYEKGQVELEEIQSRY